MKEVYVVIQVTKDFFTTQGPPGTITTPAFNLIGIFDNIEDARASISNIAFPEWFKVFKMTQVV
jgi:hypothetical protein